MLLAKRLSVVALLATSLLVPAACSTTALTSVSDAAPARIDVLPLASPKYAAVVIEPSSGRLLYAQNATELRYPASLTKMMTLYMVFDAMNAGRIDRSTPLPVSAYAASRPPTKMGLRTGDAIDVDSAIKALVTRSANDVAVAVGEALAGTEQQFAAMMTAKARSLGMRQTVFRNASGLPDSGQVTSARDIATLSIALRRNFPQYYSYFQVTQFAYRGRMVKGHNRLVEGTYGVDGIKTGYIRASGYNVATSVTRNGRRLVVVVMGADSGRQRDAHVASLIEAVMPSPFAQPAFSPSAVSVVDIADLPGVGDE